MQPTLLDIPQQLETERLRLRAYQAGDGHWLHQIYQRDYDHLGKSARGILAGLGFDLTKPDDAETFVRHLVVDWVLRHRFVFSVWHKESTNFVGELWVECKNWQTRQHEIGYFVVSDYLRQGYATETAKAGLGFVFNDLQAHKAALTCDEDNVASYRVAERCGFVREGCLRAAFLREDGTFMGQLHYGLLRSEYDSLA
ncbi:MAG: GNAT family protein [Chloroflexota bacterium]